MFENHIRERRGEELHENFFRLSFRNCKTCVYNSDDLLSYNSSTRSLHNYMTFIYSKLQYFLFYILAALILKNLSFHYIEYMLQ